MTKSRGIRPPHQRWTEQDDAVMRAEYPGADTAELAARFGRTVHSVTSRAKTLGVKKSREFLRREGMRLLATGLGNRFKKGNVPWTKGRTGFQAGGRSAQTQFKKRHLPHNHKPVGATRVKLGYLQRKVTDTGNTLRDWKFVHLMLWEAHHGPVPDGYMLRFRDGNPMHIDITNLELISRRENMARNTIARFPPALRSAIHMKHKLQRAIDEKQD